MEIRKARLIEEHKRILRDSFIDVLKYVISRVEGRRMSVSSVRKDDAWKIDVRDKENNIMVRYISTGVVQTFNSAGIISGYITRDGLVQNCKDMGYK